MKKALNIIEILTFCIVLVIMAGCEPKKTVDNRGEFYITSKPDEAKILINNVEKGVTPKSIKLVPGAYIMEVSKLNYRSNWQKIVSNTGDRKNIEIELAPITSSVLIESKPAGAILEIDGKQVGQTPLILHDQTIGCATVVG